ncbi:unnamed protein product [Coffea canephora]|uniref:Aromatic-L-amino-acid decarboxylase n=1 Tax=Coffea canephora TaxID=49390 RepID=A0A068UU09_COFCA|nr:unnamed protein product [Coffea canephora]
MGSIDANNEASYAASPVAPFRPLDPEEFRKQAHLMVDFIADYYKNIENYPVLSQVEPGYLRTRLPETAPYLPEPFETILEDVQKVIIPGMTNWLSPNFFAYFPVTCSSAAFLGEVLCTGFNSVPVNWLASPAATELEMVAVLCTLVAALDRALETIGIENIGKLVVYESDQTHSFFIKTSKLAGIFPCNIRTIPTTVEDKFSLSPKALRKQIEANIADGLVPLFLCATVGTTSTTAIDPVGQLAEVANEFGILGNTWMGGIERVDSLSFNPHKWLLCFLDCCCLWVKKPELMVKSLRTNPEYLRNKRSEFDAVIDYKDWQIGTSRRFRALKLFEIIVPIFTCYPDFSGISPFYITWALDFL